MARPAQEPAAQGLVHASGDWTSGRSHADPGRPARTGPTSAVCAQRGRSAAGRAARGVVGTLRRAGRSGRPVGRRLARDADLRRHALLRRLRRGRAAHRGVDRDALARLRHAGPRSLRPCLQRLAARRGAAGVLHDAPGEDPGPAHQRRQRSRHAGAARAARQGRAGRPGPSRRGRGRRSRRRADPTLPARRAVPLHRRAARRRCAPGGRELRQGRPPSARIPSPTPAAMAAAASAVRESAR